MWTVVHHRVLHKSPNREVQGIPVLAAQLATTRSLGRRDCHKKSWESLGMKVLELPRPVFSPKQMRVLEQMARDHPNLSSLEPLPPNRMGARQIASHFLSGHTPTHTSPECNRGSSHVFPNSFHVARVGQVKRMGVVHVRLLHLGSFTPF